MQHIQPHGNTDIEAKKISHKLEETHPKNFSNTFRVELSMPCCSRERVSTILLFNFITFLPISFIWQKHVSKCSHLMQFLASSQAYSLQVKYHISWFQSILCSIQSQFYMLKEKINEWIVKIKYKMPCLLCEAHRTANRTLKLFKWSITWELKLAWILGRNCRSLMSFHDKLGTEYWVPKWAIHVKFSFIASSYR